MTHLSAPAIWASMRVFTVERYPTGGYVVLCNGEAINWFTYQSRALNEAQRCNNAEMLRIARMREANS